jgi:hypothetical protein
MREEDLRIRIAALEAASRTMTGKRTMVRLLKIRSDELKLSNHIYEENRPEDDDANDRNRISRTEW